MSANEPTAFVLTPENFLDVLMEWMPGQFDKMRLYQSGPIRLGREPFPIECQYMQTVGGEKFRFVDKSPMGDGNSNYYEPLEADEQIILELANRVSQMFSRISTTNKMMKKEDVVEVNMVFLPGPFDHTNQPSA